MIRVVLVDDQALVRAGFRALLDAEDDLAVVGEAADGDEAVAVVRRTRPDVVLMDVRMPGTDGLEATRRILGDADLGGVRVVVLTTFELDEYLFDALRHGASGFVLKDIEPADLLRAIRVVAAGEALLSPSITRRVITEFAARPDPEPAPPEDPAARAALASLTDREREVVALVADGLSNGDIAERLHLSPATVKTHVNRAMTKLAARDRAQLVITAYRTGLARPS